MYQFVEFILRTFLHFSYSRSICYGSTNRFSNIFIVSFVVFVSKECLLSNLHCFTKRYPFLESRHLFDFYFSPYLPLSLSLFIHIYTFQSLASLREVQSHAYKYSKCEIDSHPRNLWIRNCNRIEFGAEKRPIDIGTRESGDLHIAPSRPFILPATKGTSASESTPRKVDYDNGSLAIDRIRLRRRSVATIL